MKKIVFDLIEIKEFLQGFEEFINGYIACGDFCSEKIVYEIDDNGIVFSKRYLNDELNESRFEEFIQGQIEDGPKEFGNFEIAVKTH